MKNQKKEYTMKNRLLALRYLTVAMFVLPFGIAANAATWYVSPTGTDGENSEGSYENPFATVANAIAKASSEDEIVLMKGTHSVPATTISGKKLTIRGETENRDDVIVQAAGGAPLFKVSTSADGSSISNLTIRGAKATMYGSAIHFTRSGIAQNCRFTECVHDGNGGGGVVLGDNNVAVTVKDCLFDHNVSSTTGNGLGLYGNERLGKAKAMIYVQGNNSLIENCNIVSNSYVGWYDKGFVMGIRSLKGCTIKNCEIAYNTAHFADPFSNDDAWLVKTDSKDCTLENVNVHDNHYWGVRHHPKAVSVLDPNATITEFNNGPLYPQSTPEVQTRTVTDVAGLYEALEAAEPWSEIVLASGSYVLTSDFDVKKPVTIRGATGNKEDVIIKGGGGKYCVRLWTDGAAIKDLTVSEAKGYRWWWMDAPIALFGGGLVSNCRVTANIYNGGGVYGVRNWNGTVIDTLIDGNTGKDDQSNNYHNGNGFYYQRGALAILDRSIVTSNRFWDVKNSEANAALKYSVSAGLYVIGGVVRNTQVSSNLLEYASAKVTESTTILANSKALGIYLGYNSGSTVYASAVIENCTVIDNVSKGVAQENVAGIVCLGGTVKNTLIWNNGDQNGTKIVNWKGDAANYKYCASDNVTDVEGGVKLTTTPYEYKNGIARPLASSPIVNSGLKDLSWMAQAVDLIGNKRISSGRVDIGAVESQTAGFSIIVR